MVPPRGRDAVEPIEAEVDGRAGGAKLLRRSESKIIRPVEEAQVDAVSVPDAPIDFSVQIVEEVPGVGGDVRVLAVDGSDDGIDQKINVRAATTQHERGFVLDDGALDHEFRREDGHIRCAVHFFHVAVFHVHLQHRRQPPPKTRGESAFGDGHLLDGIGVKHREKSEQVAHAVQWDAVEHNEVLVRTAAAHIQPGRAFTARLHPRHELKALQQIDFAANGR